jgi:pyruvate,orthophosphate dikinase
MFFHQERLPLVRRMLLAARSASELERELEEAQATLEEAEGPARREAEERLRQPQAALEASQEIKDYRGALERLEEFQRQDFLEILRVMQGKPVVIRLLDAPLHEFLPPHESLLKEVADLRSRSAGDDAAQAELAEKERLLEANRDLQEANPMMGHRGCRLGLTYPDIYEMQVRAVVEAAYELLAEGVDVRPEIMIPMVSDVGELRPLTERLKRVVKEVKAKDEVSLEIPFGTMIELPRAALTAGELARYADFFSFGSNDLTQMTFGFSRDDAEEKFLRFYVQSGILPANPYDTLDEVGVGRLIRLAVQEGRLVNPKLEIGLCGEHGGDAKSVAFCHRVGLDYVSCSPPRIPMARLAAAQAVLGERERDI